MTDDNALFETEDEIAAQKKSKKGGKDEGAPVGKGKEKPEISEAAEILMRERGLSMEQIRDILRNWKHLNSKEIAVRLAEFGKDTAKASAHIVVSFTRDAGYAVLTQFLRQCSRLVALSRRLTRDNKQKIQNKHGVNLG